MSSLFRNPDPSGELGPDNKPLTVLPDNTILKRRYKVKYLTSGGMGIIYTATRPDKKCIIKEVDASQPKLVIALNQEKNTLERLEHDGIVKVYDFFEEEGYYYLVLEYVEGKTLTELLPAQQDIYLSEKLVVGWAIQICDIFDYLHNLNPPIIYRDLKPDNIMLENNTNKLKMIDFGVARVFKKGKSTDTDYFGSVATASPEHYGGAQTDSRSDIYTLGATIHYLLTNGQGQTDEPFVFYDLHSINTQVSPTLEEVVNKAIALDPEDRYQTAKEFKQALITTQPGLMNEELRPKPIESPQELKKKKVEIITQSLIKKETDEDKKKGRLVITVAIILVLVAILVAMLFGKTFLFPLTPHLSTVKPTARPDLSLEPTLTPAIPVRTEFPTVVISPTSTVPAFAPTVNNNPATPIVIIQVVTPTIPPVAPTADFYQWSVDNASFRITLPSYWSRKALTEEKNIVDFFSCSLQSIPLSLRVYRTNRSKKGTENFPQKAFDERIKKRFELAGGQIEHSEYTFNGNMGIKFVGNIPGLGTTVSGVIFFDPGRNKIYVIELSAETRIYKDNKNFIDQGFCDMLDTLQW